MRNVDNRDPLGAKLLDEPEQRFRLAGRQYRRRLVHDQHRSIARDRLGNLDELFLGHREIAHRLIRLDTGIQTLQQLTGFFAQFRTPYESKPAALAPEENVLRCREFIDQVELLVDHRDSTSLALGHTAPAHRPAPKQHRARGRLIDPGKNLHQSAFARPILTDQPMHLARLQSQAHIAQSLDPWKLLAHIADVQDHIAHRVMRPPRPPVFFCFSTPSAASAAL